MTASPGAQLPISLALEVAHELLLDSVVAECRCPNCGTAINKAVFADGDIVTCTECAEELWFELRFEQVHVHRVVQKPTGTSLSQLLKARQLR